MTDPDKLRYPRARMDALFDGIFSVAMTLLVLDLRLPDNFHPQSSADLLQAFYNLAPKFFPYLMSFYVLGLRWLYSIQVRTRAEFHGDEYIRWWMFYLLLITFVPFTTIVVGRYASFAPAIWLYSGNTALICLASWRLLVLKTDVEVELHRKASLIGLGVLFASSILCIVLSFFDPSRALFALVINGLSPWLVRRYKARANSAAA